MPAHAPGSAATSAAIVELEVWDAGSTATAAAGLDPGAPAVLIGTDAVALGVAAAGVTGDEHARSGRVAVFVGDPIVDAAAVAEFAAELFPAS